MRTGSASFSPGPLPLWLCCEGRQPAGRASCEGLAAEPERPLCEGLQPQPGPQPQPLSRDDGRQLRRPAGGAHDERSRAGAHGAQLGLSLGLSAGTQLG